MAGAEDSCPALPSSDGDAQCVPGLKQNHEPEVSGLIQHFKKYSKWLKLICTMANVPSCSSAFVSFIYSPIRHHFPVFTLLPVI